MAAKDCQRNPAKSALMQGRHRSKSGDNNGPCVIRTNVRWSRMRRQLGKVHAH